MVAVSAGEKREVIMSVDRRGGAASEGRFHSHPLGDCHRERVQRTPNVTFGLWKIVWNF
jgi:hypothetical protein